MSCLCALDSRGAGFRINSASVGSYGHWQRVHMNIQLPLQIPAEKFQRRSPSKDDNIDPMLVRCWSTVYDTGPTTNQHCVC